MRTPQIRRMIFGSQFLDWLEQVVFDYIVDVAEGEY
jgi:hypothetical protein